MTELTRGEAPPLSGRCPIPSWELASCSISILAGGPFAQRCESPQNELPCRVASEDSAIQTVKSESIGCILKLPLSVFLQFGLNYLFLTWEKTSGGALAHTTIQFPARPLLPGIPQGLGMLGCLNVCIMIRKKKKIGGCVPHPQRIPLRCPSELEACLFFFGRDTFFFFNLFLFFFTPDCELHGPFC